MYGIAIVGELRFGGWRRGPVWVLRCFLRERRPQKGYIKLSELIPEVIFGIRGILNAYRMALLLNCWERLGLGLWLSVRKVMDLRRLSTD